MIIRKENGNSLLAAMFLCESMICSMIAQVFTLPNISVLLILFLMVMFGILNRSLMTDRIKNSFAPWVTIQLLLLISGFINGFNNVTTYILYFTVFGTAAAVISTNNFNPGLLFKYIIRIQTLYIAFYFLLIRRSFLYSRNYYSDSMGISYAMTTVIYVEIIAAFYNESFEFEKKHWVLMIIDTVLSLFVILIDCRSRGPIIGIIIAFVLVYILKAKGVKKIILTILMGIGAVYFTSHIIDIVQYVYDMLRSVGIEVAALKKIVFLNQAGLGVANGRDIIYQSAYDFIIKSPIIGHGIGYFESQGFNYPHNIFLETLLDFGIIGLLVLLLFTLRYVKKVRILSIQNRCMFLLLLFVGEMILNFSSTIWYYPPFWLLFFMGFNIVSNENTKI